MGPALMRTLSRLLPTRVMKRPAMQVLRAKLAVAERQEQAVIGPGIPIVGEILLENADWRRDVTLLLWKLAQEAMAANDRLAWLVCVGLPSEQPLEDLYALAAQVESIIQLHVMQQQKDADRFSERFVPPASREERRRRQVPDIHRAFAQIAVRPGVFNRATSARSTAHALVKQLSMGRLAVVVDVSQVHVVVNYLSQNGPDRALIRFLVTGDPLPVPFEPSATADMIFVRRLGLSLLDEFGLIRVSDAYIGTCDHSAVLAADAGIPCLLASDAEAHYGNRIRCVPNLGAVSEAWISTIEQRAVDPMSPTTLRTDL